MRNSDYTVESVDNALRLILMLQEDGFVRLSRAADELGVARSTAHRLLGTLVGRGFAVQDEQRRYLKGPALSSAGTRPAGSSRLRDRAREHLTSLCSASGETVHLMVLEGTQVRFVDSVEATQALRIGSRIGTVLPAHLTSGGRAMLADLPRDELETLYRGVPDGPHLSQLVRILSTVRQRGYATNAGETERGVTAVGVRVRAKDRRTVAALTVSAPSLRLPSARIPAVAQMIRDAVSTLESELAR